ncbi:proline-rich protein 19 [Lithobates pipiens]
MDRENSCLPSLKDKGPIPSLAGLKSKLNSKDQENLCKSITNTVIKARRRKTKKERNSIKFKMHKETFQKKGWLQDCPRGLDRSSNSHGPKTATQLSSGIKSLMSKQVFITQGRLTQHQGIFDHEVKSVNIERLVRETPEVDAAKTDTGTATNQSERRTPVGNMELDAGLIPTLEVKDQEELPLNQKSSDNLGSRTLEVVEMKTQVSQTESNLPQAVDKESLTSCIQGSGSQLQSTLSDSRSGAFLEEIQEAPVYEVAESINNILSQLNLFPGRNLVSEIRQSVMKKAKEMSGTSSNLSILPVQRKLDNTCAANTSLISRWGHASEGGTSVRKTTWRPQGHMQSTPVHFMPFPRDSPSHTLTKMVRPESGQQILSPELHQPVRSESGYEHSLQHHPILAENSPHQVTVQLPSEGFRPGKQDRDTLGCCRKNIHRSKHSVPVNVGSPQVRWASGHDDLMYTHNTNQKSIKRCANQRLVKQGWLPRQHLQDVLSEQPNTSEPRFRPSPSRESHPSFDVLHNIFSHNVHNSHQKSKILGVSPLESKACYAGINSHQSKSKNPFASHRNISYEDHGTKANRFQLEDSLELRNKHLFSPLGTDMDPPHDIFCTSFSQKQRNSNTSGDYSIWSSPFSLREATSVVSNHDTGWHNGDNWPHRTSHQDNWPHRTSHQYSQWKKRPIAMPPTSVEPEDSFVGFPYARSLQSELTDKLSPETWVYPRMRLY